MLDSRGARELSALGPALRAGWARGGWLRELARERWRALRGEGGGEGAWSDAALERAVRGGGGLEPGGAADALLASGAAGRDVARWGPAADRPAALRAAGLTALARSLRPLGGPAEEVGRLVRFLLARARWMDGAL